MVTFLLLQALGLVALFTSRSAVGLYAYALLFGVGYGAMFVSTCPPSTVD